MPTLDLFHGADARKMLYNLGQRGLTTDSTGTLYFAQHQWSNCLVHGADRELRSSFVCKVRADIPDPPAFVIDRSPRAGNPDALIVTGGTNLIIPCQFLEMYVRTGDRDEGFQVTTIPGPAIESYLRNRLA